MFEVPVGEFCKSCTRAAHAYRYLFNTTRKGRAMMMMNHGPTRGSAPAVSVADYGEFVSV